MFLSHQNKYINRTSEHTQLAEIDATTQICVISHTVSQSTNQQQQPKKIY